MACSQNPSPKNIRPRPELLELGGEENLLAYIQAFDQLYRSSPFKDYKQNIVNFSKDRAKHVCIKSRDNKWNIGRDLWSQERAERITWIGEALQYPTEVRPYNKQKYDNPQIQYYLLHYPQDSLNPEEFYKVVVENYGKGTVDFLTAYPIDFKAWASIRLHGPKL